MFRVNASDASVTPSHAIPTARPNRQACADAGTSSAPSSVAAPAATSAAANARSAFAAALAPTERRLFDPLFPLPSSPLAAGPCARSGAPTVYFPDDEPAPEPAPARFAGGVSGFLSSSPPPSPSSSAAPMASRVFFTRQLSASRSNFTFILYASHLRSRAASDRTDSGLNGCAGVRSAHRAMKTSAANSASEGKSVSIVPAAVASDKHSSVHAVRTTCVSDVATQPSVTYCDTAYSPWTSGENSVTSPERASRNNPADAAGAPLGVPSSKKTSADAAATAFFHDT